MRHPPSVTRSTSTLIPRSRPTLVDIAVDVVTPMFGGGVTPGQVDPLLPVRAKAVRGQLRFWWRTCRGHGYPSAARLFADEAAIWGQSHTGDGPTGPSDIDVDVEILHCGERTAGEYLPTKRRWMTDDDGGYPAYALFPFQGNPRLRIAPSAGQLNVRFRLRLTAAAHIKSERVEALQAEAEAAVWAWVTFGGVGARARRGCGALVTADSRFSPIGADPADWMADAVGRHSPGNETNPTCPRIPLLAGGHVMLQDPATGPVAAWRTAVNLMKDFRQRVDYGRNPSDKGRPGRSRWPEADSLRTMTGTNAPQHQPQDPAMRYFPRAELGLPIVFHFIDKEDPPDYSLEVANKQTSRMASPIILKPLAVTSQQSFPLVLIFDAPLIANLARGLGAFPLRLRPLKEGWYEKAVANPADIFDAAKAVRVSPLRQAEATNARDAFFNFARKEWRGRQQEVDL